MHRQAEIGVRINETYNVFHSNEIIAHGVRAVSIAVGSILEPRQISLQMHEMATLRR